LAAGEIFRQVFGLAGQLETIETFSTLDLEARPTSNTVNIDDADVGTAVLVGVGAIGHAAVWALSRSPLRGDILLVDHQNTELSNLQRYVLALRKDDNVSKVKLAERFFAGNLRALPHEGTWADFVAKNGHKWIQVLVALDSAQDRRNVQATLPYWIANAWTQPGDLGVSVHPWSEDGACLACLYLPKTELPGEDRIIGAALGLTSDLELLQIRRLLHANAPLPPEMFPQVGVHLGIDPGELSSFKDRPLRTLYTEGICGGALLPLSRIGKPTQDVHVPIAHQSALAGILLASRLAARAAGSQMNDTAVTRIDVLRPLGQYMTQPIGKDARGICICQDSVFCDVFAKKYDQLC
jgi:hypothetical protein